MADGDDDSILIGKRIYGRKGSGWDYQDWSDHLVTGYEGETFDLIVASAGPDQTVDGKTVGTFTMSYPPDESDAWTLQCTYDKPTFHPIACTSPAVNSTWRFNDPAITVPTPENAKPAIPQ
jgi:hypothetical protein